MNQYLVVIVILEIVYLAVGLILCVIGKNLLEKGITGKFTAEGGAASRSVRVATSSPGLVFLLAGLAIVISTVLQKSDYRNAVYGDETLADQVELPATAGAVPEVSPTAVLDATDMIDRMLQSITTFSTFAESDKTALAERLFEDAKTKLAAGAPANALDSLAVAVVLDPASLATARSDARLAALIENPVFGALAHARLRLLVEAQQEAPLTASARAVLDKLQIFAMSKPLVTDQSDSVALAAAFPERADAEPANVTIQRLESLMKTDPRALLPVLRDPQYRWMMQDGEVFQWLKHHGDSFFMEFN